MHRQLLYKREVKQSTSKIILLFDKHGESIGRVVQFAINIASGWHSKFTTYSRPGVEGIDEGTSAQPKVSNSTMKP